MLGKSADKANIVRNESLIASFRKPAIRVQAEGAGNQVTSLDKTYLQEPSHLSLKRRGFPVGQRANSSDANN